MSYPLNLSDAHSRLASICLDKLIRVVQGSSHFDDNFDTRMLCNFYDFLVSLTCISIGILFKHQMRNVPRLEKLHQERLRCLPYYEQF